MITHEYKARATLEAVVGTVQEIATANLGLAAIMSLVTARTQVLTRADGAAVELAEGDEMVYRAATGTTEQFLGLRLKIATSLSGMCVRTGEILQCDDSETDARVDREACRKVGVRSMLVVPLHHDNRVVGVLKVMAERASAFNEEDVHTLQLMSGLIGSAMARAELLTALNAEIEQRRAAQAEAEESRRQADLANKAKSDFLASMSHEIRTPMNAIIGLADVLADTPLTDEQREYVRVLGRAGNGLLELINDILDLSKIEAGRLELEEVDFDLHDLARASCEMLDGRARSKGIDLRCVFDPQLPRFVRGDSTRVGQVFLNLMGNAIKFTSQGEVVLRIEPNEADEVRFSVTDSGIGIAADKLDSIFESFSQAEVSTTRHFGGTGLGLSICKSIVEKMGGRIWVESRPGAGSTFFFTAVLPAAERPQVVEVLEPREVRGTGARILIAEDSEDNRLLLRTYLKSSPHQVELAENGQVAVEKFTSGSFDLVLMDMQMPVLDGCRAAAAIREWEQGQGRGRTPIVALTANAMAEDVERTRAAGCDAHLTKPIKKAALLEAIEHYATAAPAG